MGIVGVGVGGYCLFTNAHVDPLERADAIVVLGGEHDGREDYALDLARDGWASTVVISNPYPETDDVMRRVCRRERDVDVICERPDPSTTRGEAAMMRRLADERSWKRVIVVSWRYHLPRARFIFRQCFSDVPDSTIMVAVPRRYDFSVPSWAYVYAYQFGGFAETLARGRCS